MKKILTNKQLLAGALLAGAALAASCVAFNEENAPAPMAEAVSFSVSSGYEPETRTAFSGDVSGGTLRYERIDWVDGDSFCVYSAEAATPAGAHSADYLVTAHVADGVRSAAAVRSDEPLLWGSGAHTFYGLYPAPGAAGVDGALTLSENTVEAHIPAAQTLTLSGTVWQPDMHYAYMAAAAQVSGTTVPAPVTLAFRPLVTAYEISMLNFASDPVDADLSVLRLRSTAEGARLSGGFTAAIQADGKFTAAASGEGSAEVSVAFPAGVRLSTTNAVTVTLFTIPVAQTDLEIVLEFNSGLIRRLPLQSAGAPIRVEPGEKVYMDNLAVPDGWIYHIETTTPVAVTTHSGGSTSFTVESYRTKRGVRENVTWNAEFSASEDGPFTDTPPEGFALDALTGNGASKTVNATVGSQTGISEVIDLTIPHRERFAALSASPRGTQAQPYDLSMYDLVKDQTRVAGKPVTANCYLVDRAGWYMFPLVYGNAIDYNKVEDNASDKGGNTIAYMPLYRSYIAYTTPFKNANGDGMVSPYVLDDVAACGLVSAETLANHDIDAVIVWQDVESGKEIVSDVDVLWTKPAASNAESGLPCPYIRFRVFDGADKYAQGNALIALRDISAAADKTHVLPTEATILWSWHVWVTDEPVATGLKKTVNKIGSMGYNWMMPMNLGYCDPDSRIDTDYPARECWMRITQPGGNVSALVRISQEHEVVKTTKAGSNTFYQFGRKDPILPADGTSAGRNKVVVSAAGYTVTDGESNLLMNRFETTPLEMTPAANNGYRYSIQYPHVMLIQQGAPNWTSFNINIWNATNIYVGETFSYDYSGECAVVKSVYDPCPPGFSLPTKCAFTFFTVDGRRALHKDAMNLARDVWEDGFWFPCENDENGIFFPATGMRGEVSVSNGSSTLTTHPRFVQMGSELWVPVTYWTQFDGYSPDFYYTGNDASSNMLSGVIEGGRAHSVRAVVESMRFDASTDGIDTKRYDMDGLDPAEWR